jgi:hypothetical protein
MSMRAEHFTYASGRIAIAGATTTNGAVTFRVGNESFRVKKITGFANNTATGATIANDVSLRINITTKNRQLSNVIVPFSDIVGTAQLPSYIENLVFDNNTDITIDVQNANLNAGTFSVSFIGDKLYPVA